MTQQNQELPAGISFLDTEPKSETQATDTYPRQKHGNRLDQKKWEAEQAAKAQEVKHPEGISML